MQLLIDYDYRNGVDREDLRQAQEVIDDTPDGVECVLTLGLGGLLVQTHTSDLVHELLLVPCRILNDYDPRLFVVVVGISFVFDLDHINASNILIDLLLLSLFFFFLAHLLILLIL